MIGSNPVPSLLLGAALFGFMAQVHAYSLTAIHDFRHLVTGAGANFTDEQKRFPALVYEFEGLSFTQGGSLWASISANPDGASQPTTDD